jgi:hypothetical protein
MAVAIVAAVLAALNFLTGEADALSLRGPFGGGAVVARPPFGRARQDIGRGTVGLYAGVLDVLDVGGTGSTRLLLEAGEVSPAIRWNRLHRLARGHPLAVHH